MALKLVAIIIVILAGVVLGNVVLGALPDGLFRYLLILAISIGDLILVTRILFGGGHK